MTEWLTSSLLATSLSEIPSCSHVTARPLSSGDRCLLFGMVASARFEPGIYTHNFDLTCEMCSQQTSLARAKCKVWNESAFLRQEHAKILFKTPCKAFNFECEFVSMQNVKNSVQQRSFEYCLLCNNKLSHRSSTYSVLN